MGAEREGGRLLASIAALASGTLIAQLITVGTTPVLSRMFAPTDFGLLGLINAAATLLAGAASLRFDMAIVVPKRVGHAANLFWLALALSLGTSALVAILAMVAASPIADLMGEPELERWLWAAAPIMVATGSYSVVTHWCIRRKQFRRLSVVAVTAAAVSAACKLGAGALGLGLLGLLGGQVLGQAVAAVALLAWVLAQDGHVLRRTASGHTAAKLARAYREFPTFHAPMSLANTLSQSLPLYLVGLSFSAREVGLWSVTVMVLSTPVFLVSNATRQVLMQRASAVMHQRGDVARLIVRATGALFALALVPGAIGMWVSPWLFASLLGDAWYEAGEYARFLIPWQITVLASAPASAAFPVLRAQRVVLVWQLSAIAVGALALLLAGATASPSLTAGAYGAAMAVMNVVFIGTVVLYARSRRALNAANLEATNP